MEEARVDNCPICFSSLEGIDAQRWECDGCSLIPEEDRKTRINKEFKLVSKTMQEYKNSKGCKLELYCAEDNKTFKPVIFENSFHFNGIEKMRIGRRYRIAGWLAANGRYLDVVDIY